MGVPECCEVPKPEHDIDITLLRVLQKRGKGKEKRKRTFDTIGIKDIINIIIPGGVGRVWRGGRAILR